LKVLKEEDVEILDNFKDATSMENDVRQTDVFEKIEKAHELLKKNIITEEEFNQMKHKLLSEL